MRRALLLGMVLAAPAAAAAQTGVPAAGSITFTNTDQDGVANVINRAECGSSSFRVKVNWNVAAEQPTSGTAKVIPQTGISYQLWASNRSTAAASSSFTQGSPCEITITDTTHKNATVGTTITNQSALSGVASLVDQEYLTTQILAAAGLAGCSAQSDTTVHLCVQGSDGSGTSFGSARGTMTLSLSRPAAAPVLELPIGAGNRALNVAWSDPASADSPKYEVRALRMTTPSALPSAADFEPSSAFTGTRHSSGILLGGTSHRLEGLENGAVYAVAVYALTQAENPSDPSNVGSASPAEVEDFFTSYKEAGGRDTGGCASGLASPLALALLAGALALARRKQ